MRASPFCMAAVLAFAASAAAEDEPDRPRIYFPRQIKREFINSTVADATPIPVPHPAPTTTTATSASKSPGDNLDDVDIIRPGRESPPDAADPPAIPDFIKSIITSLLPPPATGGVPVVTVAPTIRSTSPSSSSSLSESTRDGDPLPKPTSSEPEIVIAPTGIVSNLKPKPTQTTAGVSASSKTTFEKSVPTITPEKGIPTPTSPRSASSSTSGEDVPTTTNESSASTSTLDETVVESTPLVNSTSTTSTDLVIPTTAVPSSTDDGILNPVKTLISSLLPGASSSNASSTPPETPATDSSTAETPVITSSTAKTPVTDTSISSTPVATSVLPGTATSESSTIDILPPLTSILDTKPTTILPTIVTSDPVLNKTSTEIPSLPTLPTTLETSSLPVVPTSATHDVPISNSTTASTPPVNPTGTPTRVSTVVEPTSADTLTTGTAPTASSTGTVKTGISTSNSTRPVPFPTDSTTSSVSHPTDTGGKPISTGNSTDVMSTTSASSRLTSTTSAFPSSSPTSVSQETVVPSTPQVPQETVAPSTTVELVTSIRPIATVTDSRVLQPTNIILDTSVAAPAPSQSSTIAASPSAEPSNSPKVINAGNPIKPQSSVTIYIGFRKTLNWNFVHSNVNASWQIFYYLRKDLLETYNLDPSQCEVTRLVAQPTTDFVATVAELYFVDSLVGVLYQDLLVRSSPIYRNGDPLTRDLSEQIDPNIVDLLGRGGGPGKPTGSAPPTGGTDSPGGGNSGGGNDAFDNNTSDQSGRQKATTAGIAVGAFGLSVMYGAAMFIVARRYKRKKQGHRRSSSVAGSQTSSEMRYDAAGSPALMGGALLSRDLSNYGGAGGRNSHGSGRSGANSGRTANISAPVAAENSLGWN